MEQDARPPRRGEGEPDSIEKPASGDVERETSPGTSEHEHHGPTGPRTAESEQAPRGPEPEDTREAN